MPLVNPRHKVAFVLVPPHRTTFRTARYCVQIWFRFAGKQSSALQTIHCFAKRPYSVRTQKKNSVFMKVFCLFILFYSKNKLLSVTVTPHNVAYRRCYGGRGCVHTKWATIVPPALSQLCELSQVKKSQTPSAFVINIDSSYSTGHVCMEGVLRKIPTSARTNKELANKNL